MPKKKKKEKFSRWTYYCEQPLNGLFVTLPNSENSTMKQGRWIFIGTQKIGEKTFWVYEKIKKSEK